VPELAEEWPEWDENSRLVIIHDWPIKRGALHRVREAAKDGLLSEQQGRDWQELQGLIAAHRATMEWILGEPI
jgi:hypothetical protein